MTRHAVAATSEIPPGGRKLVTVKGRPIAIFNLGGEYFGLLNRCPHQGGSLCEGAITGLLESPEPGTYVYTRKGEILRCPWHGWEFDLRTGEHLVDPETKLKRIDVKLDASESLEKFRVERTGDTLHVILPAAAPSDGP